MYLQYFPHSSYLFTLKKTYPGNDLVTVITNPYDKYVSDRHQQVTQDYCVPQACSESLLRYRMTDTMDSRDIIKQ